MKFSLLLVSLITFLILLPAFLFNVLANWQIIVLALSYFVFFLPTVWRSLKFGELAKRSEDRQVQSLAGRLASLVLIIGLVGVHWLAVYDFSRLLLDNIALTSVGIAAIASSILINQAAVVTLGKFFDRLTIKPEHQLVTSGIYSLVRHPIYLSYILLFAGFCPLLQSIIALSILFLICLVWFGNRIAIEEEMLVQEFKDDYKAYQQTTKKLIPFVY
ncbi:MAG: isoprenylcysteine carboxylmethyltransferase family protein [Hydrococcus sp. Prado102]|nr:isoprenylcysteine carboxylmethyltransferase family protein [Hydrococcus sp. Prado102]